MALDFAAMMKAERARARGGETPPLAAPAPAAAPVAAEVVPAHASGFRLPSSAARPALVRSEHAVRGAPPTVWHVPEFVTPDEEARLMRCADDAPAAAWTALRGRRLQNHGGVATADGMVAERLSDWLESVCEALVTAGVFEPSAPPNHVLVNEYLPGQGIDAHRDGPLYLPVVAILSLGSNCAFQFVEDAPARRVLAELLLPPRGLLVFCDDAYTTHLHTVPARTHDAGCMVGGGGAIRLDACEGEPPPRGRRVSLTVRRVLDVRQPSGRA